MPEEKKNATSLFEEMREDVSGYVTSRVRLAKLEAYEKIAKASSILGYAFILISASCFAIGILLMTIGFYLGDILESTPIGFAIVLFICLVFLIITLMNKKRIMRSIINCVIVFFMNDNKEDKKDKNNSTK